MLWIPQVRRLDIILQLRLQSESGRYKFNGAVAHPQKRKAEVKMLEPSYFVHEGGDSDFCANMSL